MAQVLADFAEEFSDEDIEQNPVEREPEEDEHQNYEVGDRYWKQHMSGFIDSHQENEGWVQHNDEPHNPNEVEPRPEVGYGALDQHEDKNSEGKANCVKSDFSKGYVFIVDALTVEPYIIEYHIKWRP